MPGRFSLESSVNHMLLLLIPVIWLAIAAFAVLLCRGAADADAVLFAGAECVPQRSFPAAPAGSQVRTRAGWRRADAHTGTRPASRASAGHARGTRVGH